MKKTTASFPFSGYLAEPFCGAAEGGLAGGMSAAPVSQGPAGRKPLARFPFWFFMGFLSFVTVATFVAA